ncbi:FecR family protein [Pedobacter sp. MW01-1-1]|uniref:FecR family protein n=1 Tax=Pedobacter sp. MW01-1-1 TaxID=3383027 RepID=UPI003FEE7164
MQQERAAYLFQQYIDKKYSAAELDEFMALIKEAKADDTLEMLMDSIWDRADEIDLEEVKADRILHRIFASDTTAKPKRGEFKLSTWMGWAAAVFIVGLIGLWKLKSVQKAEIAISKNIIVDSVAAINTADMVVLSASTEHRKVTLPDGSTVVLNNHSSIRYPKSFASTKREVVLTGEGYFDIKHDDKKTFVVHSGKLRTVVLGTAFNVRAYHNDAFIKVTVTRGKVGVLNGSSTIAVLKPNQQIVFHKEIKKADLKSVVATSSIEWQQSDLFFDDVTMEQAAEVLAKRFNKSIRFANENTKNCRFSATFLKGESLEEILKVICSFNYAQYQVEAGGITIKGEGCE